MSRPRKSRTYEEMLAAGQWLLAKRKEVGHESQKEFAGMLGITDVHLSRIETGMSGIGASTLDRAIEILKLDITEAYTKFGLFPEAPVLVKNARKGAARPLESIKETLHKAQYFEGQNFTKSEMATINALLDVADQVAARLRETRNQEATAAGTKTTDGRERGR